MRNWSHIDSYVQAMPLVKRVQVRRSSADLARELFLQTQRDAFQARMSGQRPA